MMILPLVLTLIFMMSSHPLVLGLLLMTTSVIYSIIITTTYSISWLAYLLIMVFLSGMMIIILYMVNLSSNQPLSFKLTTKNIMLFMPLLMTAVYAGPFLFKTLKPSSPSLMMESLMTNLVYKTYSELTMESTLMMITYLFIVLVVAMKITTMKKWPYKSK